MIFNFEEPLGTIKPTPFYASMMLLSSSDRFLSASGCGATLGPGFGFELPPSFACRSVVVQQALLLPFCAGVTSIIEALNYIHTR